MLLSRIYLPIAGVYAMKQVGLKYHDNEVHAPATVFLLAACSILWYSFLDAMATHRARRL